MKEDAALLQTAGYDTSFPGIYFSKYWRSVWGSFHMDGPGGKDMGITIKRRKIAGALSGILFLCMQAPLFVCGQEGVSGGAKGWMAEAETPAVEEDLPIENLSLYAASAALIDADTGRVLYGKNADTPMAMASTTKIMTCIMLLENGNLEDTLQVSSYAASMPKVKLYLKKGETYQVRDLLYSLMLESHNDSAVALAEYLGKQYLPEELGQKETKDFTVDESKKAVAAFASMMNGKAKELGCENTYYITPNGLDATETITLNNGETVQKEHSTTAAELARIMAYCVKKSPKSQEFLEITRARSHSFSANGRNFTCNNHNAFLNMMAGALSGKTGFTNKAGYCYVGALESEGRTFTVALLACGWPNNKSYKWSDTKELMQYGMDHYYFRNFNGEDIAFDETSLKPLPVEEGRTNVLGEQAKVEVQVKKDENEFPGLLLREDENVQVECRMQKSLKAPVEGGRTVGEITYEVDGVIYRTDTIVTAGGVEKIDFPWCFMQVFQRFMK